MFTTQYSRQGFYSQMQGMFEQSALAITNFVISAMKEDSNQQSVAEKLIVNQRELSGLIGFFESSVKKKNQIIEEMVQFMQMIFSGVLVFKYRKGIPAYRTKWHERADEVCKALHDMNQWNLRPFLYKQIICVEALCNSILKDDSSAKNYHYGALLENNRKFSAVLVQGIVSDNKNRFY